MPPRLAGDLIKAFEARVFRDVGVRVEMSDEIGIAVGQRREHPFVANPSRPGEIFDVAAKAVGVHIGFMQ